MSRLRIKSEDNQIALFGNVTSHLPNFQTYRRSQVAIQNITTGTTNNPIDISNVTGQIQVLASVQPNGVPVSAVQVWVCVQGETVAQCAARTNGVPAAQQTFTASGTQATNVTLFINTADFATPDFSTGADANTLYKNGLKTVVATLAAASSAGSTIASNSISSVNFNNTDTWTIQWTQPTNRANDASGITWYGGPTTPDALVPGSTSGLNSFVVVPVIYTPNRTIVSATLSVTGLSCGSAIQDTQRPFAGTFGAQTRSTTSVAFNCGGAASTTAGAVPGVTSSIDNNNAAGPSAAGGTPTAATSIYNSYAATGTGAAPASGRFAASLAYNPMTIYIPLDYQAPTVSNFDVRGGGGSGAYADSGWVNASYAFNDASVDNPATLAVETRYTVADAAVGLLTTRNTVFDVCQTPSPVSTTAATTCGTPVGTGGLTATVGSMGLPEAADLTNRAYFVIARETDRLGNRATTNPFGYGSGASAVAATAGNQTFGVDLTAPVLVTIPNSGTGAIANFVRTDRDSIFGSGTPRFAARFTDARSGFPNCAAASCLVTTHLPKQLALKMDDAKAPHSYPAVGAEPVPRGP